MKKKIFTIILCSFFALPVAVNAANADRGYLSVGISENIEVSPDVAEISFAVKTSDTKSMQKAAASNKEISDKLYSLLSDMLNPANGDYIKTSNYSATPIYNYVNNKKNFEKYEVSNRVTIHTKSLDKVGSMIDKAIAAGATNVDSLTFTVSNYDSQCDMLLGKAAKKAYNRADILVKNLSASLDGIKSVDMSCSTNSNNSMPRLYMAKNMRADAVAEDSAAGSTAISAGTIKIYAHVNTSFFVK